MKRITICLVLFFLIMPSLIAYGQGEFPELLPHQTLVVVWDRSGERYATGQVNGDIRIYDDTGLSTTILNAHDDWINGLSFSPDGSRLVTSGYDNDVRIWNVSTGELVAEILDVANPLQMVSWNKDGTTILALGLGEDSFISANVNNDDYLIIQQTNIGTSFATLHEPDNNTGFAVGGINTDIQLVTASVNSVVRILDATLDTDFLEPPYEFTTSVAWHPTANIVANGKINGWIHIWDLDTASDTIPKLSLEANNDATDDATMPFEHNVGSIAFNADGSTISSISRDGTLRTWDAETGALLADTNLGVSVLSAAFSPDGSRLVYNTYSETDVPPVMIELPVADAN